MCPLPPAFLAQDCSCLATWAQTSSWEPRGPRLWDMAASFLFMGSLSGNAEPMSQRHTDTGRKIRQWHDLSHSSTSTVRTHRAHIKIKKKKTQTGTSSSSSPDGRERNSLMQTHSTLQVLKHTHTFMDPLSTGTAPLSIHHLFLDPSPLTCFVGSHTCPSGTACSQVPLDVPERTPWTQGPHCPLASPF